MGKKIKPYVTSRQINIAEIVWGAVSRNKAYKNFYEKVKSGQASWVLSPQENAAPFTQLQMCHSIFKPLNEWGISAPIPPEKKFGEGFGAGIKGRQLWTLTHFSQNASVIYSQTIDNATVAFLVNIRSPRQVIVKVFEESLTQHLKDMKKDGKLRHQLRLNSDKSKSVNMRWYRWAFLLYDRVEATRQKAHRVGKEKIYWKAFVSTAKLMGRENRLDAEVKKIRDAYKTIKQLVGGGFRLIT